MPISRVKWVWLILFLSLGFQLLTMSCRTAAQAEVQVSIITSQAVPHFPESITFHFGAEVDSKVKSIDLVYLQASLETFQLLPAEVVESGSQVTATAEADLATYFLPAGIDLTYHWVVAMVGGEIFETEPATVTWLDDRFDWEMAEQDGIEIYSYGRSGDFLDFVVQICGESGESLRTRYRLSTMDPIRIWLYESSEDFAGTLAANGEEWATGLAYPELQVVLAVIPEDSRSEVRRVLPHEISHQILHQATQNPFILTATWIDEGLAVLAQTGAKEHYRDVVANAFEADELPSLRGLVSTFPFEPRDARRAYATSFLVMEYVVNTFGEEAIGAILEGYRAGLSHDGVLIRALGVDTDGLEVAWLETLADELLEQAA